MKWYLFPSWCQVRTLFAWVLMTNFIAFDGVVWAALRVNTRTTVLCLLTLFSDCSHCSLTDTLFSACSKCSLHAQSVLCRHTLFSAWTHCFMHAQSVLCLHTLFSAMDTLFYTCAKCSLPAHTVLCLDTLFYACAKCLKMAAAASCDVTCDKRFISSPDTVLS